LVEIGFYNFIELIDDIAIKLDMPSDDLKMRIIDKFPHMEEQLPSKKPDSDNLK